MMTMPLVPLASIMFSMMFMITVARYSAPLALIIVALAAMSAFICFRYKRQTLPRFIMDVLDRLTDKTNLQEAYEAKHAGTGTIDAAELSARIKARVIGQDAVVDDIAAQLRRRLAARRPDKPVAVFCLAGPPASARPISPRRWPRRSTAIATGCSSST